MTTFLNVAAAPGGGQLLGLSEATWIEIFKTSPAVLALLAVIYFLYRIILAKDANMQSWVQSSQAEVERHSRMITLLEILVTRDKNGIGGGR